MKSGEYKQPTDELQQHLKDTIQALKLSIDALDKGYEGEAKRLAASIRVLVHDTSSSKSLLGQLGQKAVQFYDTSLPHNPNSWMPYIGLTAMARTNQGATYVALLDNLPSPPRWVALDEWWDKVIFIDKNASRTSRKDLILAVANKDGGAHVDPVLDEKYANLSRRNSLGWRFSSPRGDVPLGGPEKGAVRQIAHEVLKTLNPAMPSVKPEVKGVLITGVQAGEKDKRPSIPKVGRNDPCPCGSGKKYKRCHGK